jgi:hypothetical protein
MYRVIAGAIRQDQEFPGSFTDRLGVRHRVARIVYTHLGEFD